MKTLYVFIVLFIFLLSSIQTYSLDERSLVKAAGIFMERCALCHGNKGMGEGFIPLRIDDYPSTNIYENIKHETKKDIYKVIRFGFPDDSIIRYMPPWDNEIPSDDIELLAEFVFFSRKNPEKSSHYLMRVAEKVSSSEVNAALLYESRCKLCHGDEGKGDGRMARIIKNPPPANFTLSTVNKDYIKLMITHGGKALRRSPQMPPWGDQLTEIEIDAITAYVFGLRDSQ